MRSFFPLLLISLGLYACGGPSTPGDDAGKQWVVDGCVIDSVVKASALAAHAKMTGTPVPRGILLMRFSNGKGHAVTCFEWEGERYAWDADFGSRRTAAPWSSPLGVAITLYPGVASARWLGDKPPTR